MPASSWLPVTQRNVPCSQAAVQEPDEGLCDALEALRIRTPQMGTSKMPLRGLPLPQASMQQNHCFCLHLFVARRDCALCAAGTAHQVR